MSGTDDRMSVDEDRPPPSFTSGPRKRRNIVTSLVAAVVAAAALAGCSGGQQSEVAVPPSAPVAAAPEAAAPEAPAPGVAAVGTVVMVIRHGEKPDDSSPLPGIDASGAQNDSALTQVGWNRAHRLVDVFDPAQGPLRPGLARPVAIYAAHANDQGEGERTRETISPLAQKLGIQVNTGFGKGDEEGLIAEVTSKPGPTLICWQHGEIPAIAQAFGAVTPTPAGEWPDERFDVIWKFTKTKTGWAFAEIPEMALSGDQNTTIGGPSPAPVGGQS